MVLSLIIQSSIGYEKKKGGRRLKKLYTFLHEYFFFASCCLFKFDLQINSTETGALID